MNTSECNPLKTADLLHKVKNLFRLISSTADAIFFHSFRIPCWRSWWTSSGRWGREYINKYALVFSNNIDLIGKQKGKYLLWLCSGELCRGFVLFSSSDDAGTTPAYCKSKSSVYYLFPLFFPKWILNWKMEETKQLNIHGILEINCCPRSSFIVCWGLEEKPQARTLSEVLNFQPFLELWLNVPPNFHLPCYSFTSHVNSWCMFSFKESSSCFRLYSRDCELPADAIRCCNYTRSH